MTNQHINKNKNRKQVYVDNETVELIDNCRLDYLHHHPEMKKIPISYNKIIYEIANFYLKH